MKKKFPLILLGAVAFAVDHVTRTQVDIAKRVVRKRHADGLEDNLDVTTTDDAAVIAKLIPDDGRAVVLVFPGADDDIAQAAKAKGATVYEVLPRSISSASAGATVHSVALRDLWDAFNDDNGEDEDTTPSLPSKAKALADEKADTTKASA